MLLSGLAPIVQEITYEPGPAAVDSVQSEDLLASRPELEAFLDGLLAREMERLHVPGLAIVFVKDGQILFSKGYGFGNLQERTPVRPDRTLFRVASVSKLLTSTAVMQLVERGLLRLDDDVA